jgi:rubrerythrin
MESMSTLKETVDFAIKRGKTSLSYYLRCASLHSDESSSRLFEDLSKHERAQQIRLLEAQSIIRERFQGIALHAGRIREYLVDANPEHANTLPQALLWASVRAETSQKLYLRIGENVKEQELKSLFISMSHEEEKRKLQIEMAYDDLLASGVQK